jgi:hypothetical protein
MRIPKSIWAKELSEAFLKIKKIGDIADIGSVRPARR